MDAEALAEAFVQACLAVFGENDVQGVVLHGSAAKGGAVAGFSDMDFMVFLKGSRFASDGSLPDDAVFAIQERIGPLPWQEAGFLYPQAFFYDARRLPEWWTGPPPGAHRVLWGELPEGVLPTAERLRASSEHFLKEMLPRDIARDLAGFIDADDASVPRRLRLLGTRIAPSIFALATRRSNDPLRLWGATKFEALNALEAAYPGEDGLALAHEFYEGVGRLYGQAWDGELARRTFRTGIKFLRWVEAKAAEGPR